MDDFTAAIERIVGGLEKKNRLLNPKEREIVAHHEMGHALAAAAQHDQELQVMVDFLASSERSIVR